MRRKLDPRAYLACPEICVKNTRQGPTRAVERKQRHAKAQAEPACQILVFSQFNFPFSFWRAKKETQSARARALAKRDATPREECARF